MLATWRLAAKFMIYFLMVDVCTVAYFFVSIFENIKIILQTKSPIHTAMIESGNIYTTKGTSSPILRRSEEDRVKLCDMKT